MEFNDGNISEFMQKEYGWIDYFGKQLELAQKDRLLAEIEAEELYSKKYVEAKDSGGTENYAKAKAMADPGVVSANLLPAYAKENPPADKPGKPPHAARPCVALPDPAVRYCLAIFYRCTNGRFAGSGTQ